MTLFNRLQTRLIMAFILLAIIPLVSVSIIISQRSIDSLTETAHDYLASRTAQVTTEIDTFIAQRTSTLHYVAHVGGVDEDDQSGLINGLLAFDTAFQEISILDANGMETERISRTTLILPEDYQNRADQPEYRMFADMTTDSLVDNDQAIYYSDVYFDNALLEPLMTIALPLVDPGTGELDKVLVADFRFRAIWELLAALGNDHAETIYVLGESGEVVAHTDPSVVLRNTVLDIPDTSEEIRTNVAGEAVLYAVDQISMGERGFIIVAEQPVSEALVLAQDIQTIALGVLILSVGIVSVVAVLTARHIVQPIEAISDVTTQIANGDFSQRVQVKGDDEFGRLGTAFNTMADRVDNLVADLEARIRQLNQNRQQLAQSEEKYRLLAENANDLIYRIGLKPEMHFEYVSPAATAMVGYTPEEHYADPQLGYKLVHPDDRYILELAAQRPPEEPVVLRWVKKDGKVIWTEQKNTLIYDDKGNIVAIEGIARDITGRKLTEQQLLIKDSAIESSITAIALADLQGQLTYVNPAFAQMWRLDNVEDAIGESVLAFWQSPESAQQVVVAIQNDGFYTGELVAQRRDGTLADIELNASVVTDDAGQPICMMGSFRDVTERKHAEKALREAEERYRTVADFSADWTYWEKPDGSMQYVSPACEPIIGFTPAEIQHDPALIQKQIFTEDGHIWDKHRHDRSPTRYTLQRIQFRLHHKDGAIRWIEHTCRPVFNSDGTFDGFRVSNADITERKQAEKDLLDAQARYKLLNDLTFEGVVIYNDGIISDANPAFIKMFGYELDALIGAQMIDLLFTPESGMIIRENIHKASAGPYEVVGIRKDGSQFPIEIEARQIDDEMRVASLQDITYRKETAQVAQENERLKAQFIKEQEHNTLIQRIISALSHDLRTPLTVISSSKEMLSRYIDRMTPEKRQEKLDTIERQIQFALNLLEDTVLIARGNLNEREFQPAPVNLDVLCQVSVDEIGQADTGNHRMTFKNLTNVDVAYVDEILVSRILLNLLSNALKYSPPESEVCLELACRDNELVIMRVIDQGMGISEDDLVHIFDPFYRTSNVKTLDGTGLGLSIVRDCVKRHRGHVHVESTLGEGTTFTVELPTNIRSMS